MRWQDEVIASLKYDVGGILSDCNTSLLFNSCWPVFKIDQGRLLWNSAPSSTSLPLADLIPALCPRFTIRFLTFGLHSVFVTFSGFHPKSTLFRKVLHRYASLKRFFVVFTVVVGWIRVCTVVKSPESHNYFRRFQTGFVQDRQGDGACPMIISQHRRGAAPTRGTLPATGDVWTTIFKEPPRSGSMLSCDLRHAAA